MSILNEFNNFAKLANPNTPFSWLKKGNEQGPNVTIQALTHGNEIAGAEVAIQLLQMMINGKVKQGTLQITLGNIEAAKQNKRHTGVDMPVGYGEDLNRCFAFNGTPTCYEEQRALELQPILDNTDLLLDLHATMLPAPPFVVIPGDKDLTNHLLQGANLNGQDLANSLNIPLIIKGKGLEHPEGQPVYADTRVNQNPLKGLGITIEAGQIGSEDIEKAKIGVLNALAQLNILDINIAPMQVQKPKTWNAYLNVIAPPNFQFTKTFGNFEQISAGSTFATSDNGLHYVSEDSIIIFPKKPEFIVVGQEACIIAKKA